MIHGVGNPPEWALLLIMAEQWGVPPWRIEAEMPMRWRQRWVEFNNARAQAQEAEARRVSRRRPGGGRFSISEPVL